MKILLLNGPPRCGKDTLGKMVRSYYPEVSLASFAEPLKRMAWRMGGVPYSRSLAEEVKDVPQEHFWGKTPREVYIAISELLCKPFFGYQFFGTLAVEDLNRRREYGEGPFLFTDSGFVAETEPLVREFGAENVRFLRIERPGCNFLGDSRGWVEMPAIHTSTIRNDGSLEQLILSAKPSIDWLLGEA